MMPQFPQFWYANPATSWSIASTNSSCVDGNCVNRCRHGLDESQVDLWKSVLTFPHSPFLFTDPNLSLNRFIWQHSRAWFRSCTMPHCSLFSFTLQAALRAKRARTVDQRSVGPNRIGYLTDPLQDLKSFTPKFSKKPCAVSWSWEPLFPFAWAQTKCGRNGPLVQVHWGIRVRPTPKVLWVRSLFGRAGEKRKLFRQQTVQRLK